MTQAQGGGVIPQALECVRNYERIHVAGIRRAVLAHPVRREVTARFPARLVALSGDGYVVVTAPRDEPNASERAFNFYDPHPPKSPRDHTGQDLRSLEDFGGLSSANNSWN